MSDHSHQHAVVRALEVIGSLRITVTLFALSQVLVFFGTLAQIDAGIWTVVSDYFRSFVVLMPLQLLVKFWQVFFNWLVSLHKDFYLPGAIPFPGGWSIGAALMINLLAAYSLRVPGYMKHGKNYALMFVVIALDCAVGYFAVIRLDAWWFLAVGAATLAANAAALLPYRKAIFFPGNRIGIFTLHLGIVLMLVGELITGLYAVEGYMRIEEGETTSVVIHNRTPELAFVDNSAPEAEKVTVIPGRRLEKPGVISHEELPVDVEIVQYMPNSRLKRGEKGDADNPATKGHGLEAKAALVGEVSGVDAKQTAEVPSVYARLTDKSTGADLGIYLFSLWLDGQKVTVNGKTYDVSLRFKQTHKPYSLQLLEFRFDRYPGTNTAKNFSSRVRLRDPERGDDREVLIKMNSPMRHRGDTFFQAGLNEDTEKGTVLQVVRNPAWQLPYWSCAIVALGMLIHFGLNLANFLERRAGEGEGWGVGREASPLPSDIRKRATVWAPLLAALFGVVWFGYAMRPASNPAGEMQVMKFGTFPVQDGGRIKPIDSFARVQLMNVSRRQDYNWEILGKGKDDKGRPKVAEMRRRPAIQWFLNLQAEGYATALSRDATLEARRRSNDTSVSAKVFRIDNDQLKALLGLEPRDGHRYSLAEILTGGAPEDEQGRANRGRRFKDFMEKASTINQQLASRQRTVKDLDLVETKVLELDHHLQMQMRLRHLNGLLLVPPGGSVTEWKTLGDALAEGDRANNPNAASMEKMVRAYAEDEVKAFNTEVETYARSIAAQMPAAARKARIESWFNQFAPFYQASLLYLVVLALAIASWAAPNPVRREALRRSACALACMVVVVHSLALGIRIYLTERPPVTNLYSASVFIGWGCVLLCLFLERTFRNGIAVTGAAVLGFATMIVAHHLGTSGDTMEVLQAVLDTNFWLATHVTTVALGYSATFVAGLLGAAFVYLMLASVVRQAFAQRRPLSAAGAWHFVVAVFGLVLLPAFLGVGLLGAVWGLLGDGESLDLLTLFIVSLPIFAAACIYAGIVVARRYSTEFMESQDGELPPVVSLVDRLALTPAMGKALGSALYGVVCFATLLSFVGTVLGGIWADQSWGRFWGWDPKENGALMIVVMNALILHARWAGLIKERGMSLLAILGGMITVWSYFGTNQLGVGLHAYGFNNTLALGCAVFWLSQLGVMAFGLLPRSCWRT